MPHLDVMMPGEDGLTILRSLDRATSPAVIILSMIGQEVDRIVGLEMGADEVLAWSSLPPISMNSAFIGDFVVAQRHGATWRVVASPPSPMIERWHHVTLLAMLVTILALAWPSWALARAISRPIREMAESASAARAGVPLGALPAGGVGEVRLLAAAIARMHDRLSRHAEGRTTMLAAIAHDLGTPLSRLAFWAEQLPDEARANADLDEMRAMLGSVLRFARDESKPATDMRIDLGSLLDSLTEDMNIAEAHRGTVVLDNHPGGGPLRVTLLLDPG